MSNPVPMKELSTYEVEKDHYQRLVERIDDEYAKFREEKADLPTHLILDIGTRQALKLYFDHPNKTIPTPEITKYLGMKVLDRERALIIEAKKPVWPPGPAIPYAEFLRKYYDWERE